MKRTIEEVMDILEQKRENVQIELDRIYKEAKNKNSSVLIPANMLNRLRGEYDAYTDVICLIASSHLLNRSDNYEN